MLIDVKNLAIKGEWEHLELKIYDRLPVHVRSPSAVACRFQIQQVDKYYLLTLHAKSTLTVICQRCLQEFAYQYTNVTQVALASSDEMADKLMEKYECIVTLNDQLDLQELVTDELHLYVEEFHREIKDCDNEVAQYITDASTISQ
jgi:uncharacterized protein